MVRSIFALAAVLSVASASLAADMATPVVYVGSSTSVQCRITNLTSATIPAKLELIDWGTSVLSNSGPITLPAGSTYLIHFDNPGTYVYCRFVNASKSKVRAELATQASTGDFTDQLIVAAQ